MKKLLIPAICILVSFSFSGKYSPKLDALPICGPSIHIDNNYFGLTITKVDVRHMATGVVTSYNSPSFPFIYGGNGGALKITYYFSGTQSGSIWWHAYDECQVTNFSNAGSVFVNVFAGCGDYYVTILDDPEYYCQ